MKLHQLSVFLENRPGRISAPCKSLADAGINIVTLSLADTQQFGIIRLIVKEWSRAKVVLESAGCVVNVTEVVAVEMDDVPGTLAGILSIIEKLEINVEYMYAFTFGRDDKAIMVFRFEQADDAIAALSKHGVNMISHLDIQD